MGTLDINKCVSGNRETSNETMVTAMARRLYYFSTNAYRGRKQKSPFSNSFREEQRNAFQNDEDLIARFDKLSVADLHLCKATPVTLLCLR